MTELPKKPRKCCTKIKLIVILVSGKREEKDGDTLHPVGQCDAKADRPREQGQRLRRSLPHRRRNGECLRSGLD